MKVLNTFQFTISIDNNIKRFISLEFYYHTGYRGTTNATAYNERRSNLGGGEKKSEYITKTCLYNFDPP